MTETFRHSRKIISGTGWSNPLTHAFQLENSAHVKVYADTTLLTLGVDYTLDEIGNPAGYEVNIVIPDPGDEPVWWDNDLFILSVEAPVGQDDDISLGGQFGVQFEGALDRLARRLQQVYDMALRAIKSPLETDPATLDQADLILDPETIPDLLEASAAAVAAADSAEEDAIQTALDRIATGQDVVQTGLDRAAVAADKATVVATAVTVASDKAIVAADKATVAADKIIVAADRVTAAQAAVDTAADAVATAADVVTASAAVVAAVAARDAAIAAFDGFDDVYLGPKAANPTLDNDGNALVEGQLYWNTTDNELRFYDGATWVVYNLAGYVTVAGLNNTNKAIIVDADRAFGGDSAAGFGLVYYTFTNVWTWVLSKLNATNKAVIVDADRAFGSDSASSFSGAQFTFTNIWTWVTTKLNATNKAVIVDADRSTILDSAASNVPKYATFTNVWTWVTTKLNATNKATPVAADRVVILDSAASNVPKYSTFTNVMTLFGALISGSTAKTVPVAADLIAIADSAATDATKKVQVSELKAVIQTDPTITGTIKEDVFVITDAAGYVINPADGSIQRWTLTASRTPGAAHANWTDGVSVTLFIADGTAYAITWSTLGVVWKGGVAPTLATSGYTEVNITKENGVLRGVVVGDFAS
mgnify:CR=1 FL=1